MSESFIHYSLVSYISEKSAYTIPNVTESLLSVTVVYQYINSSVKSINRDTSWL